MIGDDVDVDSKTSIVEAGIKVGETVTVGVNGSVVGVEGISEAETGLSVGEEAAAGKGVLIIPSGAVVVPFEADARDGDRPSSIALAKVLALVEETRTTNTTSSAVNPAMGLLFQFVNKPFFRLVSATPCSCFDPSPIKGA